MVESSAAEPGPETPPVPDQAGGGLGETVLCPYLRTDDGDWRAAWAYRDHRCGALDPPAPLSGEKQRRLCLVAQHVDCATFQAAARAAVAMADATPGGLPAAPYIPPRRWPIPRTAPVVLDRSGRALVDRRLDRSLAQVGLAVLMLAAFVMLALARLSASTGGSAEGGASAAPSVVASSSPEAPTYRVQAGDTLVGIAARFGTTVAVLQDLNGIEDPSKLRVGQLLHLPEPSAGASDAGPASTDGSSSAGPSASP